MKAKAPACGRQVRYRDVTWACANPRYGGSSACFHHLTREQRAAAREAMRRAEKVHAAAPALLAALKDLASACRRTATDPGVAAAVRAADELISRL